MDVLTHFFIPYVVALFVVGLHRYPKAGVVDVARRETLVAYAVVFGLAGFAPDLDSLFSWARHYDGLYALQHRGGSHTFLFAPLLGMVTTGVLHLLALWRPRHFGRFRFRPGFIPVTVLGAWSHLVLDFFTFAGTPALWPFTFGRVGYPFFHWIVIWMFPVVLVLLGLHLWGKLKTHHMAWLGVGLIVALVILGGMRHHYRPDVEDGELFPRSHFTEWTVVRTYDTGYEVVLYAKGERVDGSRAWYPVDVEEGTEWALEKVRATSAYQGFRLGQVGPVAAVSHSDENGTVHVTFTDVAARFEAQHDPRWTPTDPYEAWGYVAFRVTRDDVMVDHLGW